MKNYLEKNYFIQKLILLRVGSGHYLLENHDIVFAFNSTIILEALAANKIVFAHFKI